MTLNEIATNVDIVAGQGIRRRTVDEESEKHAANIADSHNTYECSKRDKQVARKKCN